MKKLCVLISINLSILLGIVLCSSGCKKDDSQDKSTIVFNPSISYGSMTDQDGNKYKTVTIGTQTWMAENLRTTKFNDGTEIPIVSDSIAWHDVRYPGCCYYNNDPITYKDTYGALYNGQAVMTGKLAPIGWHVPTWDDMEILFEFLGGHEDNEWIISSAGGKMKEVGYNHWISPNIGATNESGFTALPGGLRSAANSHFLKIGYKGYFWTSTYGFELYYYVIDYEDPDVFYNYSENLGLSVRCVKD